MERPCNCDDDDGLDEDVDEKDNDDGVDFKGLPVLSQIADELM